MRGGPMFQTRCRTSTVVLAVMVILGIAPGLALGAPITLVPNTTPIISWVSPAGFVPEAFRVNIFDVDGPTRANGAKDIIHSAAIPASSVSYTIPATLSAGGSLQAGHNYSINFQVIDLRSGA